MTVAPRKKILFISSYAPSLKIPEAGQKLAYRRLKDFSEENDVFLVYFYNKRDRKFIREEDYSFCKSVLSFEISNIKRLINFIFGFATPLAMAIRSSPLIAYKISKIIKFEKFDLIHAEYEQSVSLIDFRMTQGIEFQAVLHDVISQAYSRLSVSGRNYLIRFFYGLQLKMALSWERKYLKKLDRVIVLSDKDRDYIENEIGIRDLKDKLYIDPPYVSEVFYRTDRSKVKSRSILFWGAMNRIENESAVIIFCEEVLPKLLDEYSDLIFYVVGANPTKRIMDFSSNNIKVTGFVEDPSIYFEECLVSVAPLTLGAGVKLKVLESLASGITVVGTSVAAEGITNNNNLIVSDKFEDWPSIISNIIKDHECRYGK